MYTLEQVDCNSNLLMTFDQSGCADQKHNTARYTYMPSNYDFINKFHKYISLAQSQKFSLAQSQTFLAK